MQAQQPQAGPSSARVTHRLPLRLSFETPSDSAGEPSSNASLSSTNAEEPSDAREPISRPPTSKSKYDQRLVKWRADAVRQNPNYSPTKARQLMTDQVSIRCRGKLPYHWQTDLSEAMSYRKDCVIIAGTGAGKTLPFAMPLFLDQAEHSKILIVSTLNELERDQVRSYLIFDRIHTVV